MRRRSLIAVALLAVVLAVVFVARGGGGHRVSFTVQNPTGLLSGFDVRDSGQAVGKVASVDLLDDYRVRVVLKIDDAAWPLPAQSRFKLRHGGTIHFSDRYVEVLRRGTAPMRDDARLPASAFVNAVEYDDLFKVFDGATRNNLRSLIRRSAQAAPMLRRTLPGALGEGAPAATSTAALLRELGDDPRALDVLVRSASGVARAAASADPGLGTLVDGASRTFAAVGRRSRELQGMLAATPATLQTARQTAARVDTALLAARGLTDRLRPAVAPLRELGRPLSSLLRTIDRVGPSATLTLSTLRTAAPGLTRFLDKAADPALPLVQRVSTQAEPQVGCIRPFSPEIAGLATTWATLWGAVGDDRDAYFRAQVGLVPYPNEIPVDSGTVSKALPAGALRMAFPRPPGQLVNKPWFQPQCGITEDALDASKDPEAQAFDPLSKKIIDMGGR